MGQKGRNSNELLGIREKEAEGVAPGLSERTRAGRCSYKAVGWEGGKESLLSTSALQVFISPLTGRQANPRPNERIGTRERERDNETHSGQAP